MTVSVEKWLQTHSRLVFTLLLLVSCLSYLLGVVRVKSVLWGDTRYYYAITRSLVMDGDVDFANEAYRTEVGFPNEPVVAEKTGRVTNKYSPGAPLMWIPGFLAGQVASVGLAGLGVSVVTDGYGIITQIFTALSTVAFSVAGLYLVFQVMRELYDESTAWLTVGALFFTTHLLFYTAIDPLNSHSASFLFSAGALWLVVRSLQEKSGWTWQRVTALGLVVGGLALVRNQDAAVGVAVAGALLLTQKSWSARVMKLGVFGALSCLVLSIQLLIIWYMFGQLGSPYTMQGGSFEWLRPDIVRVLFSPGNGLLTFAPLAVVAVAGLVLVFRSTQRVRRVLGWMALGIFILELYVIAAWGEEIIGGPYGSRMFVSSWPWLAVGLAEVIKIFWKQKSHRAWMLGIGVVLMINNAVQTLMMLIRY